jgi:hypothetical protein
MKKQVVIYQLVLDRSGSMLSEAEETVTGFNEQVQRIHQLAEQYPNQEILVNLCLFNHHVVHPHKIVSAGKLEEMFLSAYHPNGMTALYDAIGQLTTCVRKRQVDPALMSHIYHVLDRVRHQFLFRERYKLTQQPTPLEIRGNNLRIFLPELDHEQIKLSPLENKDGKLSEVISKIKNKILRIMGQELGRQYIITGQRTEKRNILSNRQKIQICP